MSTKLRNVAVVGFAQLPIVARDEHRMSTEMLYPVVREALAQCRRRARRHRLPGVRLGRLHRRPAVRLRRRARRDGLVAAAAGPAPRDGRRRSPPTTRGSSIQTGECDTAIVCGHGKTSEGEPERVLNLQLDPYYQAPLGLDPTSTVGAAGERLHGAHRRDRRRPRRRRGAQPRRRRAQPRRAAARGGDAPTSCSRRRGWSSRCAQGYLPPIGESATCLVLAAEGKAEKLCERAGVDPRRRPPHRAADARRARPVAQRRRRARRARRRSRWPGSAARADVDLVELLATNPAEELIVLRGARARSRSAATAGRQSVGRRALRPSRS